MNRLALKRLAILLAAGLLAAAPARVPREQLRNLERGFDQRLQRLSIDEPLDLMGNTRAIYIEKYGAVLTAEVNLVTGPAITPFRPELKPEEKERLRQRKLSRLPAMKQLMRDMMVTSATALKAVPAEEQIAVGITFFYNAWENTAGLPSQLVLQAPRKALTDFETGRIKADALAAAIQEQVF